jgi:hypothetical protein
MANPPTFDDIFAPSKRQPTVRERAAEQGIEQSEASIASSRASAAKTGVDTAVAQATMPSTVKKAAADAELAELKVEKERAAIEKTRALVSSIPPPEKLPEAREIVLRELRNLAQAKELSQSMFSASGIGYNMLKGFSGSPAATVSAILDPIGANEAFTALSKMRAESPTGGALGNVTERELELLKAAGGLIPPTAGDKEFQQGIDDLISKRLTVLNRLGATPDEIAQALGPANIEQFADKIEAFRFRKEDEAALEKYVADTTKDGTYDPSDFAALASQAYYRATGREPDENFIKGVFDQGFQIQQDGRTSTGGFSYKQADDDTRNYFRQVGGAIERPEIGLGEAVGGAALNFVPSTFELAADTVQALTLDLPETLEGVVQIVGGATGLSDPEQWEAVKDYYADRYGSYEGFKQALREDPASIAADIAGIATGGGLIAAKAAGTAGKITKIGALSDAAKKAEGFTQIAARLDPLNTSVALGGTAARAAGRTAENLGVVIPSKLVGAQPGDVRQAFDAGRRNSDDFRQTFEGSVPPEDLVGKAQGAVGDLFKTRSRDYTARMSRLKKQPETLDFADVDAAVNTVYETGRHKGIDISSAADVWSEVDGKVAEFRDAGLNTIEDFDAMKRAIRTIGDKYPVGTPQHRVANEVAKSINKTIEAKAPIYANIMKDYRLASDTLADVQSTLSLGAASQDTILRKLKQSSGGAGPRGRTILDLLESTPSGKGLGDMIAAQGLRQAEPSGLGAMASGAGAVATGDPGLLAAAAGSPQALGRTAFGAGQMVRPFDQAFEAIGQTPVAQGAMDLAQKYGEPAARGLRMANPSLIQPQVDPFEKMEPEGNLAQLLEAYSAQMPTLGGSGPSTPAGVSLDDLAPKYEGPSLPEAPSQSTIQVGGRTLVYNEELDKLIDTTSGEVFDNVEDAAGAIAGYKRGGAVQRYREGGPTFRDRARAFGEGALFGFNDEIEAGVRAAPSLMRGSFRDDYRRNVDQIRAEQERYMDENLGEYMALMMGGAMAPALVPGMQGAAAARVASVAPRATAAGRGLAVKAAKAAPKRVRGSVVSTAKAAPEILGQSALYGVGVADDVRSIPRSMAEEMGLGLGVYGAGSLAARPIKRGVKKVVRKVRGK